MAKGFFIRRVIRLYGELATAQKKIDDLREDLATADGDLDELGRELNAANEFIASRGLMAVYRTDTERGVAN